MWVSPPDLSFLVPKCNEDETQDRKSTRLNSSHTVISYAVFCLKIKAVHRDGLVASELPDALVDRHVMVGAIVVFSLPVLAVYFVLHPVLIVLPSIALDAGFNA